MSKLISLLTIGVLVQTTAAFANDRYAIQMTVLNDQGTQRHFVNNGATYSQDECFLEKRAWERKEGAMLEAAMESIRAKGGKSEMSVDCTRVP